MAWPEREAVTERTKRMGRRLQEVRMADGLSLSKLAAETGVLSKSRISNYERGARRVGLEQAEVLARCLAVSPAYLLMLEE